jgi:hypothetical protein
MCSDMRFRRGPGRFQKIGCVVLTGLASRADHGVASSINTMIGWGDPFTSSMTDFNRFSNSPLTPARPEATRDRAFERQHLRVWGHLLAMRSAKPSTTAVLPTPASPGAGLFWRRRVRISMI